VWRCALERTALVFAFVLVVSMGLELLLHHASGDAELLELAPDLVRRAGADVRSFAAAGLAVSWILGQSATRVTVND